MKYLILYIIMFTLFLCSCKKENASNTNSNPNNNNTNTTTKMIEDLLVKNNEISGWAASGSNWAVYNNTDLTDKIDGGAEVYIRNGFVEASRQTYQGKVNNVQAELVITVYNQNNKTNAAKLYNDPDLGLTGALKWSGAGEEAQYARFNGMSQTLVFYRDKYFVYLNFNTDSDESLGIIQQFAKNVDSKILK